MIYYDIYWGFFCIVKTSELNKALEHLMYVCMYLCVTFYIHGKCSSFVYSSPLKAPLPTVQVFLFIVLKSVV